MTHLQSGSTITTDAPVDNHGKGEKFSPTDMVAGALGSCMLTIMGIAAETHNFSLEGLTMNITKVMGTEPRRIAEIIIEINFPRNYSDKQKKIIEQAVKSCPVAQSLHPDTKQTVVYNYPEE